MFRTDPSEANSVSVSVDLRVDFATDFLGAGDIRVDIAIDSLGTGDVPVGPRQLYVS